MAQIDVRGVLRWQGACPLWELQYFACLDAAVDLCNVRAIRCYLGAGHHPFTQEEMRDTYGFVSVFAPALDVGFVIAGQNLGKSWFGRPKRALGVYASLPVTGRLERVQIVNDARAAVAVGAKWFAEAAVGLGEVTRSLR